MKFSSNTSSPNLFSYCLVATRESLRLNALPGKAVISRSVEALLQNVRQDGNATELAAEAYKNLLGSVPEMGLKKRLIVVPDSPLAALPFEILIAPSGKTLLQSHIVTYAPSGTVLALLRETPAADHRAVSALAVAAGGPERREGLPTQAPWKVQRGIYDLDGTELPPLPAAEEEAKAVISIVGGDSVVLTGAEATEAAFKQEPLSRFRSLHFAVHGLISTRYPDRSALVFRTDPQGREDGLLQVREIVTLPLQADLVTLSACDTGTGKINGQEGSATLVRPFLVAGAKAVVANLWSADDDFTRTLMKEFYSQLDSGLDVGSALTQAKLRITGRYGKAAPSRLWAGFIVVGDGLRILSGDQPFHGRIVVLVNQHSASASEMIAAFAAENKLATIVGEKTPGRVVGANSFKVGHGYRVALVQEISRFSCMLSLSVRGF